MLFKLSIRNLRKSLKDYAIYFFTLILGVAIFYVFNAIEESTVLMELSSYQTDLVDLLTTALGSLSIFVCVVLAFLIIYANQFLMKRRKKEFGIYMLLGMGKQSISKLLLVETFFIGLLSLIIGLIIGIIGSQFMSILVAKMFDANLTRFEFVFSNISMFKTIAFFGVIYIIVMLFNTFSVSKCKLINLLNAVKQAESIKVKNNVVSTILFIVSIAILSYAYYYVLSDELLTQDIKVLLIPIGLGCLGTLLFFYSVAGLLLNIVKSNKRFYYKNLNAFVVRQLNSKINTTVISMSVISILLFLTICILSSGLTIKASSDQAIKESVPVDVTMEGVYYDENEIEELIKNVDDPEASKSKYLRTPEDSLELMGIDVENDFKEKVSFNTYAYDHINYTSLEISKNAEEILYSGSEQIEMIIRISDYNKLAKLFGKETYTLKDNEYMMISQLLSEARNKFLNKNIELNIGDNKLLPKYSSVKDGFLTMSSMPTNLGFTIVPDNVVSEQYIQTKYFAANFADLEEDKINDLNEKLAHLRMTGRGDTLSIKSQLYESSVGIGTIATFIGLYLGIIFLISGAAILALKELSESSDNVYRYEILRKIGVSEKMINRSLFAQIGIFFILPLLVACVHSYFGILFANQILWIFGGKTLYEPIFYTSLFIILIYGGYFLLTYFCSKVIIKNK